MKTDLCPYDVVIEKGIIVDYMLKICSGKEIDSVE